jgi:hypothetical protein
MGTASTVAFFVLAVLICKGTALAGTEGTSNTFFGVNAGPNTVGDDDEATFVGADAGASNTTGRANSFVGYRAGRSNTDGSGNSFLGSNAGVSNTTGSNNNFIGNAAGSTNTTGHDNTFIGLIAGGMNTAGYNNQFIGSWAGYSNTEGYNNNFLGTAAGYNNIKGHDNSFLGHNAGNRNTTGYDSNFIGSWAGYGHTNGFRNNFLGNYAGYSGGGNNNTFLGHSAGYSNTEGSSNLFLGNYAGHSNTRGILNVFLGHFAGYRNSTASHNTFLGIYAGSSSTQGHYNTLLGYSAGFYKTEGNSNTFVGYSAGYNNTTGSSNVFLGYTAGYNEAGSNKLYIDSTSTTSPLIYGDFATNRLTINGSVNVTGSLTKGSGSFVQPHPSDPAKEVVYAFFEGPEHAVFLRGKAKLAAGSATIETPSHFRAVAGKDEDITVQLTPRYANTFGLAAVRVTKGRIDVRELKGGTNTYEFDYFITAKRAGFEGHEPIQPNTHFTADMKTARDFEKAYEKTDDLTIRALRNLLISNGILTKEGELNRETAAKLGWTVKEAEVIVRGQ